MPLPIILALLALALTPAQRTLRASIAANVRWSREDPVPNATRGQAGLVDRFRRQVDPDNQLTEAERERRALSAYKAHMQRLALASSKARARRAAGAER